MSNYFLLYVVLIKEERIFLEGDNDKKVPVKPVTLVSSMDTAMSNNNLQAATTAVTASEDAISKKIKGQLLVLSNL